MKVERETVVHYEGSQIAATRDDGSHFLFRLTRHKQGGADPASGPWMLEVTVSIGTFVTWFPCAYYPDHPALSVISAEQRDAQHLVTRVRAMAIPPCNMRG